MDSSFCIKLMLLVCCLFCEGYLMGERKCICCGAALGDEDVMKIVLEDGSCETVPFDKCPECFKNELLKRAHR